MNWWKRAKHWYWRTIVRPLNYKAYLHREIRRDPEGNDWESREELLYIETQEWTRRGEKVNVWIEDVPLPKGETSHWKQTTYDYDCRYIHWDGLRKLKKLVEDEEYERSKRRREGRKLWVKYVTAVAAILGALAGFANLYISAHKK